MSLKLRFLLTFSLAFLITFISPTEAFAVIQSLNSQTGQNQTFQDDTNVKISSSNNIHSIIWSGLLPISRGGTGASSFSNGSLPFISNGAFSEDNSNLFWDNLNKFLGIGTASPTSTLDVNGNTNISGNLNVSGTITGNINAPNLVPYTGATSDVNLGIHNLTANGVISNTDANINTINVGMGGGSVFTNTVFGKYALISPNVGGKNTALGFGVLADSNYNGQDNTAVGASVLSLDTSGSQNTAVGANSLYSNTSGNSNVALGFSALQNNNAGGSNTAIGFRAGLYQADLSPLTSAQSSIYIGAEAKGLNNNDWNSIVVGDNTTGAGPNTTVIGNVSMGNVYFGSASANANIHAKKLFLGSSSIPGCIIMGDSDGSGITYITVNDGVLSASTTPPSACQ